MSETTKIRFLRDWDPKRKRVKGHVEDFPTSGAASLCEGSDPWAELVNKPRPKRSRKKSGAEDTPPPAAADDAPADG